MSKLLIILILGVVAGGLSIAVLAPGFDMGMQGLGVLHSGDANLIVACECVNANGDPITCDLDNDGIPDDIDPTPPPTPTICP